MTMTLTIFQLHNERMLYFCQNVSLHLCPDAITHYTDKRAVVITATEPLEEGDWVR